MKLLAALFLLTLTLTQVSCKDDELQTEKYVGVWNYETSQGCKRTMRIKAVDDNSVLIEWSTSGCVQNTVSAQVTGNSINIPEQTVNNTRHLASGTITENSIQFPQYRFWRDSQYWVLGVTCSK